MGAGVFSDKVKLSLGKLILFQRKSLHLSGWKDGGLDEFMEDEGEKVM